MVTDYGAFIKIPGCRKQGLVHRTHMSSCRVDKPSEIVDVGDKVWVKLIGREMKNDRIKVSLSMKVVNQGTGKDLDPNNVIIEQEERRRRSFQDYTGQKITLEAVLNTTCKKCGCKGHFAKDCFMQPGGTKYSLVPEEEEEKRKQRQKALRNLIPQRILPGRERRKRRRRNIETGSRLTVIALTLRVTRARRRGTQQKTARLQRRKRRRRNTRRSTRNDGGAGRSSLGSCKDLLVRMWPPTPLTLSPWSRMAFPHAASRLGSQRAAPKMVFPCCS